MYALKEEEQLLSWSREVERVAILLGEGLKREMSNPTLSDPLHQVKSFIASLIAAHHKMWWHAAVLLEEAKEGGERYDESRPVTRLNRCNGCDGNCVDKVNWVFKVTAQALFRWSQCGPGEARNRVPCINFQWLGWAQHACFNLRRGFCPGPGGYGVGFPEEKENWKYTIGLPREVAIVELASRLISRDAGFADLKRAFRGESLLVFDFTPPAREFLEAGEITYL